MMLGWMIAFLAVGFFIGIVVMSSCINDYIKNHKPSELKWELVKQMDELYSANVKPYIVS